MDYRLWLSLGQTGVNKTPDLRAVYCLFSISSSPPVERIPVFFLGIPTWQFLGSSACVPHTDTSVWHCWQFPCHSTQPASWTVSHPCNVRDLSTGRLFNQDLFTPSVVVVVQCVVFYLQFRNVHVARLAGQDRLHMNMYLIIHRQLFAYKIVNPEHYSFHVQQVGRAGW